MELPKDIRAFIFNGEKQNINKTLNSQAFFNFILRAK